LPENKQPVKAVRIHLTNVAGLGAVQLVKSLLPALEACDGYRIDEIYLPGKGDLADYHRTSAGVAPKRYRRLLPNALSRFLECTVFGHRFDGTVPLLVLGDLPIRCSSRQAVFVQTTHLVPAAGASPGKHSLTFTIARLLFRFNCRFANAFIVQTAAMKNALESAYPRTRGAIHVLPQPVPKWLLDAKLRRHGRNGPDAEKLELFYPAARYRHKNHDLLATMTVADADTWPVATLVLTIPGTTNPNPRIPWLQCVGALPPARVLEFYAKTDALLFLSTTESYGFPLLEAMWTGLPIICPDLPYARDLCGRDAIYFDAHRLSSLRAAVVELRDRLRSGWWPDWTQEIGQIPDSWEQVAAQMLRITASAGRGQSD
jgi:hypothetical protein